MRLDNERPSANVEDRRGQSEGGFGFPRGNSGGFGFPGNGTGRRINLPIGSGRGGLSITTLVVLVIVYFAVKLIFGVDLLNVIYGAGQ
jgi:predicted metalloprotease